MLLYQWNTVSEYMSLNEYNSVSGIYAINKQNTVGGIYMPLNLYIVRIINDSESVEYSFWSAII